MSIFFDFNVGENIRFRRAIDSDRHDVEAIVNANNKCTEYIFGYPDFGALIELSTLSICMINDKKDVIGFMALCDHPNVPGVDPSDWEIWIRNMFQLYYLSRNTLFIHFFCCIDSVTDFFLEEAFISIFRNDVYLLNIVLMVPYNCPGDWTSRYQTFKKRNMYKFKPKTNDGEKTIFLYTAMRKEFCPKLKIRRAVEEDNDDLVYILGKNCPKLQELYGDFYISEIIGRHPEIDRKIIVAEFQDRAVGVMCLNSDINYHMLQTIYELEPLRGLRKATALEKEKYKRTNALLEVFGEPIMLGKWSPFHESQQKFSQINNDIQSKQKTTNKNAKVQSKVNFDRKAAMRQSFDHFYTNKHYSEDYSEKEINSPTPSTVSNQSFVHYLLDEDPFDYEIVNIDNCLLTVPEMLSCEFLLPNMRNQGSRRSLAGNAAIQTRNTRRASIFNTSKESQTEKYAGGPNAFMIELFGLREDIDDRQSFHLLEAAFEIMKDYDYCIIRVPCRDKGFHLLQHFTFVPVKDRISSEYALYVAHRNSVLSKLRVRVAETLDIPQIAHLLRSLDGRETLSTIENTIIHKNQLKCYVFLSNVTIIGIGILERPEHIDFMRAKFNMDSHRLHKYHVKYGLDCGLSTIKTVVVYSVFEVHYRFFAREIMRLSASNSLIWLTAYRNKLVTHKANSLAGAMIPLMPRNSEIDCTSTTSIPALRRLKKLSTNVMAFSSWFINKKLTSVQQVDVNTRILVVGASRTTMAFLNSLLFSDSNTYLFFTNVTLVSPSGLPYTKRSNALAEMLFQKFRTNSDKFIKSVPYTYYVNVIQGSMLEINKRKKYIVLSNGRRCDYDLLFLLFGKQYQHPEYLKPMLERSEHVRSKGPQYTRLDIPQRGFEPVLNNFTPANVFIINTLSDANKAIKFIKALTWHDMNYKIIVYGARKHAYCCLATLVEMKVPSRHIVFIEPFPSEDIRKTRVSMFCNEYVDTSIIRVLENLKIEVHRSFYFQRWHIDDTNLVTQVEFLSQFRLLQLKCSAFFYYGTRGINEQAFIAINKSGMAYDGGILIDHEFRTKDPSIYAAGPATRYHRKYHADTKRQKYYDAYEVGFKLGSHIRDQLDPLFKENKEPKKTEKTSKESVSLDFSATITRNGSSSINSNECIKPVDEELIPKVPNFTMPHVAYYILPGELRYLEVQPPGMRVPHQYVQSMQYNGFVMETFKNGYFKLHLNQDLIVDGITCLTSDTYSLENFKNLYGLSGSVLNNVHFRYTTKKLNNFYTFFRAPWACFLYHDETKELFSMIKELFPKGQRHGETLSEALQTVGENLSSQSFNFDTRMKIRWNLEKSPHVEAITDYVLEWLSENEILLPMYLQPSQTAQYEYDLGGNPAFKKRKNTIINIMSKIF